jgi:peptide deformylase
MSEDAKVLKLVESNHPILHQRVQEFDFKNPPVHPIELANQLITTMNHHNGMGLSANQCGLPYRVFVMRAEPVKVCFNPKILITSEEIVALEEGCLSYPFLFVKIKRPIHIRVRYTDAFGEVHTERFIGMTARCFLHEYDHLEGFNYLTRANPVLVERAKRSQLKIQKRLKAVSKNKTTEAA